MTGYDHILVAVDFSRCSDRSIETARLLARQFQSTVSLVHVIQHQPVFDADRNPDPLDIDLLHQQEVYGYEQLHLRKDWLSRDNITAQSTLLTGASASDLLLDWVASHQPDLVILGSHGQTNSPEAEQGSVCSELTQYAGVPLLTVHRSQSDPSFERLLVAVDFSVHSGKALEAAAEIAREYQAKLSVLHVIEPDSGPAFSSGFIESYLGYDDNLPQLVLENLHEFVDDVVDKSSIANFIIKRGSAHEQILELAGKGGFDLLTIATHGLNDAEYLPMGDTAEKISKWAECSLLLLRRSATWL